MSLRLGFDIDGVLADFRSAFRATAHKCLRLDNGEERELTQKDVDRVWAYISETPNWWMTLQAFEPEEIARLYGLSRATRWEVFFLTKRPPSGGDTVQFQTQWWLEDQGFYLPSVVTVPGSRGELANSMRLDLIVDDQFINCAEIIGASTTKVLLMQRQPDSAMTRHATDRGVGVVSTLAEALPVLERLNEILPVRRGKPIRLSDWFTPHAEETLPLNPREARPKPEASR